MNKMFELTNEQRRCFAIPPVLDEWERVEVKPSSFDDYVTYAYLDGKRIVKVIEVSDLFGQERYREYGVDETLSDDGTQILPKTAKGKPQNFTSSNLTKKTHIGMSLIFYRGYLDVYNMTTSQSYYHCSYNGEHLENLCDLSQWINDWCENTGEAELAEICDFSKRKKIHQKFKEGDFFRYRINRRLYGYGRILVDYAKMRKDGIPFWDIFMGKPLCVAVYYIATEDVNVSPSQLAHLKMLPSQMIMDNIFYYGECEVIGNMPIAPDEDNYTIHYGASMDARKWNFLCYQSGKTYVALEGQRAFDLYKGRGLTGYRNNGTGFNLNVKLPILLECINKQSNDPYWSMMNQKTVGLDLRNPKLQGELQQIKKQMGII